MNELKNALAATLSPVAGQVQNAANTLQAMSTNEAFPGELLSIIADNGTDCGIRQAGAIYLKNLIKRVWDVDGKNENSLSESHRLLIKEQLPRLILMPYCPPLVTTQLTEALTYICATDFPFEYPQLFPYIIDKVIYSQAVEVENYRCWVQNSEVPKARAELPGDIMTRPLTEYIPAISIIHAVLKRYRDLFREDYVLRDVKFVLPFTQGIIHTLLKRGAQELRQLNNSNADSNMFEQTLKSVHLLAKIFLSLNSVDLPEYFEDNMGDIFGSFVIILGLPLTGSSADKYDDTPSTLVRLKSTICSCILIYADKYQEELQPYVPTCTQAVWEMLKTLGAERQFDSLVVSAIDVLCSCVRTRWERQPLPLPFAAIVGLDPQNPPCYPFEDLNTFKQVVKYTIVDNMTLNKSDLEQLLDNGLEYMRLELGGEAFNSRRGCALEFAKALRIFYDAQLVDILREYVCALLENGKTVMNNGGNPLERCIYVDAATSLFTCIYIKSSRAPQRSVSSDQNNDESVISNFIKTHLFMDLEHPDINSQQITKVAAIKLIATFRLQLNSQTTSVIFPVVIRHLASQCPAVHTAAAYCVERLLCAKDPQSGSFCLKDASLNASLQTCAGALRGHLNQPEENEYILKCLFRVLTRIVGPEASLLECLLSDILMLIKRCAALPKNPAFCHYLFECLGACIKIASTVNLLPQTEAAIIPVISVLVEEGLSHEFTPYCFQILSMLVDSASASSALYTNVFLHLLKPPLWIAAQGNVPGLVRLLCGYFIKFSIFGSVISEHVNQLLERIQFCLYHRRLYTSGFELLNNLFMYVPMKAYESQFTPLLTVLLTRAHELKSAPHFVKELTQTLLLLQCKVQEPTALINGLESIQSGLSKQVICMIISPSIRKTMPVSMSHLKLHILGIAKLACCCEMLNDPQVLEQLLLDLCMLIQGKDFSQLSSERTSKIANEAYVENQDTEDSITNGPDFDIKYSKLTIAGPARCSSDMVTEIKDLPGTLRSVLHGLLPKIENLATANAQYVPLLQLFS